jgi:uncharacterized protein (TIGR03085 family)
VSGTAARERAHLADVLAAHDADAPTLDEGWTCRDLAAHVVARDRRPDSALGLVVPPLAGWTERVRRGIAARDYDVLVAQVRSGPAVSPMNLPVVGDFANTLEFAVHAEDAGRGEPGWQPRMLPADVDEVIWAVLSRVGRLLLLRSPVAVTLETPDGRSARLSGRGEPVTLRGPVLELALYLTGRREAAQVDATGSDQALAALGTLNLAF